MAVAAEAADWAATTDAPTAAMMLTAATTAFVMGFIRTPSISQVGPDARSPHRQCAASADTSLNGALPPPPRWAYSPGCHRSGNASRRLGSKVRNLPVGSALPVLSLGRSVRRFKRLGIWVAAEIRFQS